MVSKVRIDSEEHPRGGHVATVCHDNAEKLNVMDRSGADALSAAIERTGGSRDVRVIVLRGAGERAFIGGADIRAMVDLTPESSRPFITLICVPVGAGMNALLNDEETLDFVRRQASGARYVTSVCTGSLAWQIFDRKTIHLLEPRYRTSDPITSDTLEGLVEQIDIDDRAQAFDRREENESNHSFRETH